MAYLCSSSAPDTLSPWGSQVEGAGDSGWWFASRALVAQIVKNPLQCRRPEFDPWVGKIPWRRDWQPPPVPWEKSLALENFMDRETWGLQSIGLQRAGHD